VPSSTIIADTSEAVIAAIVAGAGIGMAANFMAASRVSDKKLVPLLCDFAVERHDMSAVWHESRRSNPAVRAFLDHMLSHF
jgi:DNA-binding transcriptional LysR family regulator